MSNEIANIFYYIPNLKGCIMKKGKSMRGSYQNIQKGSAYFYDTLSWKSILSQPYGGWIKWKHVAPTNFPGPKDNIFLTVTGNKFVVWNYIFSGSINIYLFECRNINQRINCKICSNLTIEAPGILLVSLMLTLNISDSLFYWLFLCM